MARNRVIYQSEVVYAGTHIDSTQGPENLNPLSRIQSANYGLSIARKPVNELSHLGQVCNKVVDPPTVSFDISNYLTDTKTEKDIGFGVSSALDGYTGILGNFFSKFQNFGILTGPPGLDLAKFNDDPLSVTSGITATFIREAYLSELSMEASVGGFATTSTTYTATDIFSSSVTSNTSSNQYEVVDPQYTDTTITHIFKNPVLEEVSSETPSAIPKGGITLTFSKDGSVSEIKSVSTLPLQDDLANSIHIQNFNMSIPIGTTPLQGIGDKKPYTISLDFPTTATITVSAILNEVNATYLEEIVDSASGDIVITIKGTPLDVADDYSETTIVAKGVSLSSENLTSSIGSNKSVDLSFEVQISGSGVSATIGDAPDGIYLVHEMVGPHGN